MDAAALQAAQRAAEETALSGVPTEVVNRRREYVYEHTPGLLPGTPAQQGLGRCVCALGGGRHSPQPAQALALPHCLCVFTPPPPGPLPSTPRSAPLG